MIVSPSSLLPPPSPIKTQIITHSKAIIYGTLSKTLSELFAAGF